MSISDYIFVPHGGVVPVDGPLYYDGELNDINVKYLHTKVNLVKDNHTDNIMNHELSNSHS